LKGKTKILHVGCGNAYLTNRFDDVEEVRVDLCPGVTKDFQLDARNLKSLPESSFDGVWMCHVLEHVYEHQVPVVLDGIRHVLNDNGFLFVTVPDLREVFKDVLNDEIRLDDNLYVSYTELKIRPLDVIYGYQEEVSKEQSRGAIFNQHLTGFDSDIMLRKLTGAGFKRIYMTEMDWEVKSLACVNEPTEWVKRNFKLYEQEILQTI
jgi:predicted SAM-dependent methyltransferase